MISVYVSLECATPTNRPDGHFGTLVAVPELDFLRGAHIKRAMRHASIAGYSGPYRVVYAHCLGAPSMSIDDIRSGLEALAHPRLQRWLSIVDDAESADSDRRQLPPSPRRSRFRRSR
jgi:hypothetical protein